MRIEEVVSGIRAILAMRLVKDHGFSRKRVAEVLGDEPADDNPSPEREGGLVIARKIVENGATRRYLDELVERILSRGMLTEGELYDRPSISGGPSRWMKGSRSSRAR
jgi:hypothetical protein